jgi:hypothetical protein
MNQRSVNHRVMGLIGLKDHFFNMILVTKNGSLTDGEHLVTGAFPNPLDALRLLKLGELQKRLERHLFFPSAHQLYVRAAVRSLSRLIRKNLEDGLDVTIVTCLPPHDLSMIGLSLKAAFPRICWLVDWQDLWSYDEYYFDKIPKYKQKKLLSLEKHIVDTCDMNITTNEMARDVLQQLYQVPSQRLTSICHHFDVHDLENTPVPASFSAPTHGQRPVTLGFLGTLFKPPKMPGARVVAAVEHARHSGLDVRLEIVGDSSDGARRAARACSDGAIVLHGRTSHRASLAKIAHCDFLLLAMSELPNCRVVMNIKLPHYLLLGRPILALVPEESVVADIVRATGSGYVIAATSDWGEELVRVVGAHLSGQTRLERVDSEIMKYSWESVRCQWLEVISCGTGAAARERRPDAAGS